jgi:DNA-binding transcriptional LysR family regulator
MCAALMIGHHFAISAFCSAASASGPTAGEVRVRSPESFMAGLIPAIIDRVRRRYPKIFVKSNMLRVPVRSFENYQIARSI